MSEWQPIETAPKETPVWVVLDNGAIIMAELVWVDSPEGEGWIWSRGIEPFIGRDGKWSFTDGDLDDWRPVLWMDLPEPPNDED